MKSHSFKLFILTIICLLALVNGSNLAFAFVTPSISINDITVNEDAENAIFTITLSQSYGSAITVEYSTAQNTALAAGDYTNTSGTVTIPAGNTLVTVTVPINNDTIDEENESFYLNISNPSVGEITDNQGICTITDDDAAPTMSISDATVTEGNSGTANLVYTVTLFQQSGKIVTVDCATQDGTATVADNDYTAKATTLTFAPGETSKTITVEIPVDTVYEPEETFTVNLSGASNASIADSTALGTITDNDAIPKVTLSADKTSITEAVVNDEITVTVTLSNKSYQDVTVEFGLTGTAVDGSDYSVTPTSSPVSIIIPAGSLSGAMTLTVLNDSFYEGNEPFSVEITSVTNGTEDGEQKVDLSVIDNETVPSVTLSVSPSTFSENAGTTTVTATLSNMSEQPVTVNLNFTGTAASGTDYLASNTAITISTGNLTGAITLTAIDNEVYAGAKTVIINIDSVTIGTEDGTQQVTATIAEDEADTTPPAAPTAVTVTPVGGTVIANTLNKSNTNMTATATITAGDATDGRAELYLETTLLVTDDTISSGDTQVTFDLGKNTNAELQAAAASSGTVSVKLYDADENSSTSSVGNPTLTVDYSNPTPVSGSPLENATNVSENTNLVLILNENVEKGTGYINIKKTSDDSIAETIDVTSGQVAVSGATVTIDPSVILDSNTEYYVLIGTAAFRDTSGNYFTGVASTTAWSFTTMTPVITAASVAITAPVPGAAPQDAETVETATNHADYTVTNIVWNEDLTAGLKFKADRLYTATITLTSKNGKKFQSAAFTPSVEGSASVGTTTTAGGDVVGNTISFTVTYPVTDALTVSSIAITTQPTKTSYTETTDGILALNGMQVTETNNDGTTNVVTFTDGTATDYTSNPANGAALTNTAHNGHPVVITHTASGKTASTNNLTVNPAPTGGGDDDDDDNTSGNGGNSNNSVKPAIPLVTKIESGENVTGTNVELLVQEGESLTVEGKAGENLVFDTEALKNIASQTQEKVEVVIRDVSTDHQDEHPGRLVVSLTIIAGDKRITNFGNGSVTVSLPYELKEGEKPEDVTVWYLAEDGTMTELPCSYDPVTKMATFTVNHFSMYIVGTEHKAQWVNPFSDVKENDWYFSAVQYVVENGLMNGTDNKTFSPVLATSRGMIATILYRHSGSAETAQSTFTDVKPGAYYAHAAAWAQKKGIIAGYGNGMFGPDDSITREQMATMLWRYAGSPVAADSKGFDAFNDAIEISAYAKNALTWANQLGIIKGKGNGLLDPKGIATRAEAAQIIQNFMQSLGLIE
ncbi:MAG: hypothetical protein GX115_02130 [Ruminiclostridium sp.]|nr:hypothetical protein [Ruminiclostridium sp.]